MDILAYILAKKNGGSGGDGTVAAKQAEASAKLAEAYAKGTVGGTTVTPGQTGYNDNAKYYANLAGDIVEPIINLSAVDNEGKIVVVESGSLVTKSVSEVISDGDGVSY